MRNAQDHANAAGQDLRISGLSERLTEVENRIDKLAALRHRLQRALRHAE